MSDHESPLEKQHRPRTEVSFETLLETCDVEQIASAIYTLDPQSAVDVFRYESRMSYQTHRQGSSPEWFKRLAAATGQVIENSSASGDPEWEKEVGVTLATSPVDDDRQSAAFIIPSLTKSDRETGMLHWDHLLRDQDSTVREVAHIPLEAFSTPAMTAEEREERETVCAEYGITLDDGWGLEAAFQQAEGGTDLYDPPVAAALQLGELLLRQPQPSEHESEQA